MESAAPIEADGIPAAAVAEVKEPSPNDDAS